MLQSSRVLDRNEEIAMPFIPPNRYWARPDWKQVLKMLGGGFGNWPAPVGSFQVDLVAYQQKRDGGMSLLKAWTAIKMRSRKARESLMTAEPRPNNLSGIIPPEIFSRVLARSRATTIDPTDDAADAIVENPPQAALASFKAMAGKAPLRTKAAKRKAAKKKSAKSTKRKTAPRKAAIQRRAKRGRR
jgi:hypothetical protein